MIILIRNSVLKVKINAKKILVVIFWNWEGNSEWCQWNWWKQGIYEWPVSSSEICDNKEFEWTVSVARKMSDIKEFMSGQWVLPAVCGLWLPVAKSDVNLPLMPFTQRPWNLNISNSCASPMGCFKLPFV